MIYTILMHLFLLVPNPSDGWKQAKQKDGIAVWTKDSSEIDAKAFLAKTTINASQSDILKVLLEPSNYPEWLERCKKVEIIEQNGDSSQTVYMKIGIPWPFQDRDMVQSLELSSSKEISVIEMINKPDAVEEKRGLVRLQNTGGQWKLKTIGTKTEIQFTFWLDPGGLIPSMLANIFLVNGPYKNLLNLRQRVADLSSRQSYESDFSN
ncbi:MAG: SRPBCC family protein [Bacteroidota bacterium]